MGSNPLGSKKIEDQKTMLSLLLFLFITTSVYHFLSDLGKEIVPVKKKRIKRKLEWRGYRWMYQACFFGLFQRLVPYQRPPKKKRKRLDGEEF